MGVGVTPRWFAFRVNPERECHKQGYADDQYADVDHRAAGSDLRRRNVAEKQGCESAKNAETTHDPFACFSAGYTEPACFVGLGATQADERAVDHKHHDKIDDGCHLRHDLIGRFNCWEHKKHQSEHRHEYAFDIQKALVYAVDVGFLQAHGEIARLGHCHQAC